MCHQSDMPSVPQIVMDAVDKPRQVNYKGAIDLVTNTDIASEEAVLKVGSPRACSNGCRRRR